MPRVEMQCHYGSNTDCDVQCTTTAHPIWVVQSDPGTHWPGWQTNDGSSESFLF